MNAQTKKSRQNLTNGFINMLMVAIMLLFSAVVLSAQNKNDTRVLGPDFEKLDNAMNEWRTLMGSDADVKWLFNQEADGAAMYKSEKRNEMILIHTLEASDLEEALAEMEENFPTNQKGMQMRQSAEQHNDLATLQDQIYQNGEFVNIVQVGKMLPDGRMLTVMVIKSGQHYQEITQEEAILVADCMQEEIATEYYVQGK